jgi:AmmeMemoRadiSam system protein A
MARPPELGALLLALARGAIARELGAGIACDAACEDLARIGATFVTLRSDGELRGCIGTVHAWRPLGEDVRANAVAAAFRDPRFPPLHRDELGQVCIEVSLLNPSEPLPCGAEESVTASLRPGIDGVVLQPVDFQRLAQVADQLQKEDVQAVALCFLNSCANAANETAAVSFLRERLPHLSISASTQLVPQIGEYERTSTTVVNVYIRPVVERYIDSLHARLKRLRIAAPLMIMQSSGGIAPGAAIAEKPIYIIESGPAAGVLGSQRVAAHAGVADLIVFDMGGTTAKATIIEGGRFGLCPETEVGGGAVRAHRHAVVEAEQRGRSLGAVEEPECRDEAAGGRRLGGHDAPFVEAHPGRGQRLSVTRESPAGRRDVVGVGGEADRSVAGGQLRDDIQGRHRQKPLGCLVMRQ